MQNFEQKLKNTCGKAYLPFARFSIFVIYFWFGAIKVFCDHGAANPLVVALLSKTMPFINPGLFLISFGSFEMIIGLCFLVPRLNRLALILLAGHLVTTIMPLVLLPHFTWKSFLVPTLEGQYIIKNILLIALAIGMLSHSRE